jgi:putative nucleotidyltransferase with HDIG domain
MTTTLATASLENKLKQIIANIRNLPTPPIVFEQIQKVINEPDTSVGDVAKILSEDPAMSVKILKLTNSAFYGLSREVDSVKHAVMIIGLEAVKNLVLSASVLNMFKANEANKEYHENFWRHSLATAFAARIIAKRYKNGKFFNPDPAFSAGLIHDIGKMVFSCFMPKEHQMILEHQKAYPNVHELEAEITVVGFNHAQMGRQLAINWKLPPRLADTIGYHHTPDLENVSDNFAYLINLADYVALVGFPVPSLETPHIDIATKTLEFFEAEASWIDELKTELFEEYMKAETFMKIAGLS